MLILHRDLLLLLLHLVQEHRCKLVIAPIVVALHSAGDKEPPLAGTACSIPNGSDGYVFTVNFLLLVSVPPGVVTSTKPVVAPAGTVVVISDAETTVNVAAVPLNVTLVEPVKLLPRIVTAVSTLPEAVCVSTNGPRSTDRLKTVPLPFGPPDGVVP